MFLLLTKSLPCGLIVFVLQATAEQIRLAQMIYDKNDADFEDKVNQVRNSLDIKKQEQAFFTADILTCHNRKHIGVTDEMTYGDSDRDTTNVTWKPGPTLLWQVMLTCLLWKRPVQASLSDY